MAVTAPAKSPVVTVPTTATEPEKKTVIRDSGIGGLRAGGGAIQTAGGVLGKLLGGAVKVIGFGVKTAGDVFDSDTLTKAGKDTMKAGKQVNKDAGGLIDHGVEDMKSGADEWKDGMLGSGRPVL